MRNVIGVGLLLSLLSWSAHVDGKVYFQEDFLDGDGWRSRWVPSKSRSDYGRFQRSRGKFHSDDEKDYGLQTSQDAHFYSISSSFETPFHNVDKAFVLQFSVKHEQASRDEIFFAFYF